MFCYFPQLGKLRVQSAGQSTQEENIINWGFYNCPATSAFLGTAGSQKGTGQSQFAGWCCSGYRAIPKDCIKFLKLYSEKNTKTHKLQV